MKKILILIFFFVSNFSFSQSLVDSTLIAIRNRDYTKISDLSNKFENNEIKVLLNFYTRYKIEGKMEKIDIDQSLKVNPLEKQLLYHYLIAEYYTILKDSKLDSLIFNNYFKSYNLASYLNNPLLKCETLRRINKHILLKTRDSISVNKYLNLYRENLYDQTDKFWVKYFEIGTHFLNTEKFIIDDLSIYDSDYEEIICMFDTLKLYANSTKYFIGIYHNLLAIYQSAYLNDYKNGNINFIKAKNIFKAMSYYNTKLKSVANDYNIAINYYKLSQYEKAIPIFLNDLKRDKENVYIMYTHEWLYKCYEKIGQHENALLHFKKMIENKDKIDEKKHSRIIREIEKKYDYDRIVSDLESVVESNISLKNKLITIIPILGLILVLFILSYYLYKKYKKRSKVLTIEKSKTEDKIDELKEIVFKTHIVLKNKMKIYFSDVIYINVNDHNVIFNLTDNKTYEIRDALSRIKKELPPNFIQCHKSYVVNSNYIRQINPNSLSLIDVNILIPLSRGHRDKFSDGG